MLQFMSKAGQFITDTITGQKTKDAQFQSLRKKMITIESGIKTLKSILKGYNEYTGPFCKYLKLLNDSMHKIYKYSPMIIEVNEIINKHSLIIKDIENLGKTLSKIYSKTSEWDAIFQKAQESIKIQEEKRKNFDHYEQKLLKIDGDTNKKKIKDFVFRNKEKYNLASREYIEAYEKSFELIKSSIKLSWELANPVLSELIDTEKDFFANISTHLESCEDMNKIFSIIMESEFKPRMTKGTSIHNAKKFIKSKLLNKEINYEHKFIRNTNSFGKIPPEREQLFNNIKDKLLVEDDLD